MNSKIAALTIAIAGCVVMAPRDINAQQVAAATATGPTVVKCGDAIESPGEYKLAAGCQSVSGNAITIHSSGVHLDMGGFTISGPGVSAKQCKQGPQVNDGIVVAPRDSNARITALRIDNGWIVGFIYGISVISTDAPHLTFLGVARGCNGILLQGSHWGGIHDDTIKDNLSQGLVLMNSNNNWIHHNTLNANGVDPSGVVQAGGGGLLLVSSNHNLIGGNEIVGNGSFGLVLGAPAAGDPITLGSNSNFLLQNNASKTKAGPGIRVGAGNMNVLADNTASYNNADGAVIQSAENLIQQNTVNLNSVRGILSNGAGAVDNVFRRNSERGNNPDLQDDNLLSCANTWRKNDFVTDNESGTARGPGKGCIQ